MVYTSQIFKQRKEREQQQTNKNYKYLNNSLGHQNIQQKKIIAFFATTIKTKQKAHPT